MAQVALDGAEIESSVAGGHITVETYEWVGEYCLEWNEDFTECIGGWEDEYDWVCCSTIDATVYGNCIASSNNVYFNGSNAVLEGDYTSEYDDYSTGGDERYVDGAHSGENGYVTVGNNSNVYVNGKSVSVIGSDVETHAGTSSSISSGGSSNIFIGN